MASGFSGISAWDEVFAPGNKHLADERKRLALTRTQVGDSDPARGPIDLTSGKVTVRGAAGPGPVGSDAARSDATPPSAAPVDCPALSSDSSTAAVLPPVPRVHRGPLDLGEEDR
ncbi:DUF6191 domain-containing protein [Streptomyces sp. NPDC005963]|uniref:DUF6191 domain-containing protein n=1 Tax=Streptomyces sp. NPDC005963 TaxID=3156721 RepID=UPI00340C1380